MEPFIHDDFLLENKYARELYHGHAAGMPIIDYHNHLNPQHIAEDYSFSSITELWLGGDHYKWRAMRANGVGEEYITGNTSDKEKFVKWAETVPFTMRNPMYHWTHMELVRYFGINDLLDSRSAGNIYDKCNEMLADKNFSVRNLLLRMDVETLCTTDDPVDDLRHHIKIRESGFGIKVLPTWRPDKVMAVDDPKAYNAYIALLESAAGMEISNFDDLIAALKKRQEYFQGQGCRLSDHGLGEVPAATFTDEALRSLFVKIRGGKELSQEENDVFRSGMLYHLFSMNAGMGWTQQLHIGAIRNNNLRLYKSLGPDIGCDSIADAPVAAGLSRLLGMLDNETKLAPTVFYNLNPKDTEVLMSMAYNFNEGPMAGKMQYGAAWWFLDQRDGIIKQIEALSAQGLLSRFVGMLTDSRSFVSFPRHEYFRRILCNILGSDIERGMLPASEAKFIGSMAEDISYYNARNYFNF